MEVQKRCDRPVHRRGLCQAHYRYEMRRAKDPDRDQEPGPKPDPGPYSKPPPAKERGSSPPQSHPFDEENTYIDPAGSRQCRTCRADRSKKSRTESEFVKSPGAPEHGGIDGELSSGDSPRRDNLRTSPKTGVSGLPHLFFGERAQAGTETPWPYPRGVPAHAGRSGQSVCDLFSGVSGKAATLH